MSWQDSRQAILHPKQNIGWLHVWLNLSMVCHTCTWTILGCKICAALIKHQIQIGWTCNSIYMHAFWKSIQCKFFGLKLCAWAKRNLGFIFILHAIELPLFWGIDIGLFRLIVLVMVIHSPTLELKQNLFEQKSVLLGLTTTDSIN